MNEKEAREIKGQCGCIDKCPRQFCREAKGYLEAIDKTQALEECIDGLLCGTCDAETAEEVLRKWRREK
jgi:hypothetical protein